MSVGEGTYSLPHTGHLPWGSVNHPFVHTPQSNCTPSFAKSVGLPGRILHGVCSMTFAGEAFVNKACGGDPLKLKRLKVRFSKPAQPGQTITTRAYEPQAVEGLKKYRFVAMTSPKDLIITGGEAEVRG